MRAPLRRCQWPQQMMHSAPYGNHIDPICGWLNVNARGGHLQGGIVFPDVLAKRYGGRGEACTMGRLRIEQVPQWLRRKNGEEGLTTARSAFSTTKVCVSPGCLIRPNHSLALLALSCPTPYVKHRNTGLIKFWKGDVGCCVQVLLTPCLSVPPAVAVSLMLALLVCQPGTGLCVLLAVAISLLLSGCGGHVVQIIPLAVSGRNMLWKADWVICIWDCHQLSDWFLLLLFTVFLFSVHHTTSLEKSTESPPLFKKFAKRKKILLRNINWKIWMSTFQMTIKRPYYSKSRF